MADLPATQGNWTREQTLAALHVYLQLPYGQLHSRNPKIKQLAPWLGRTANSVALKLVNLASLDPAVQARGRKGMGNASTQDRLIWTELQRHWDATALQAVAAYESLAKAHGVVPDEELVDEPGAPLGEGRTRSATVQVRINQARFRKAVLASYDATCCISGLQHEKLVIASHIVPWSDDKQNRLNPQNGLCLSALHDRAYDQGLITVLPNFNVQVSSRLKAKTADVFLAETLLRFDGQRIRMPERFAPSVLFLERHAHRFGFL